MLKIGRITIKKFVKTPFLFYFICYNRFYIV